MFVIRAAVALAVAGAVVVASDASAGANTLRLTDVAGDANALNSQSDDVPVAAGNIPSPVQRPEADLLSVTFASLRTATGCAGFTVRVQLAAPAADNMSYRVTGQGTSTSQFWLEHAAGPLGAETLLRTKKGGAATDVALAPAQRVGNTVMFTVRDRDLRAAGENLGKFVLYMPGVEARSYVATPATHLTAPLRDSINRSVTQSYRPCQ